jgi:hypothetical protein
VIQQLKDLQFNVTDEGQIEDYLGVRIQWLSDEIQMSQPHLIQQILQDLNLEHPAWSGQSSRYTAKTQDIPAPGTVILQRDTDGEPHKEKGLIDPSLESSIILRNPHRSTILFWSTGISLASSQTYWAILTWHER